MAQETLKKSFFCLLFFIASVSALSQVFTVEQAVTGNNRSDIRGQVFKPSEQGSGSGSITSPGTVYLNSFSVVYAAGTEAPTLYIYSVLPSDITSLDNGSASGLVGESSEVTDDFPYIIYHFDYLALDKNTTYYALFRQDVTLEFGASGNSDGPYPGGKMVINNGTAPVTNDFTALRFEAEFDNTLEPHAGDVEALTALYNSTNGASWTHTWDLDGDPYEWYGVEWSGERVIRIDLTVNNLAGTLPPELGSLGELTWLMIRGHNNLDGEIPVELGNLSELESMIFFGNKLEGAIPGSFANLANLRELVLSTNELTGEIPGALSNLSALESLILSSNHLEGAIPSSFGYLANLSTLWLSSNDLTGEIPNELGNLANLQDLRLSSNELTGEIPAELGNLSSLELLFLSSNQLTGEIPVSLGSLTAVQSLSLEDNELTGEIPVELGNLSSLKYLYLSGNQLMGAIPASIGNLSNLETLQLQSNDLTGQIPNELGNLANLQDLRLSNNGLTGEIPDELGNLALLVDLFLSSNQLEGPIPASFGNLTALLTLWLSSNELTGEIPTELGNLAALEEAFLSFNKIEGTIPDSFGNLTALQTLRLSNNELTGEIPAELGNLSELLYLELNNNQLEGSIPDSFGNLTKLQEFFLSGNGLSGILPASLSSLSDLTILSQHNNRFDFGSFEPLASFITNLESYTITPQAKLPVAEAIVIVDPGSQLQLEITTPGANNLYQWFKDSDELGEPESSSSFTIDDFGTANAGTYFCKVTNGLFPGAELESEEILVTYPISFEDTYPKLLHAGAEEVTVAVKTNKAGEVYYVALPAGSENPDAAQVIAQQDGTGAEAATGGSFSIDAGTESIIDIGGLTAEMGYDIYLVAKDNEDFFTEVTKIQATTITGLEQSIFDHEVKIYPNPASTFVSVDLSNCNDCKVRFFDQAGAEFNYSAMGARNNKLDIGELTQGVYLIQISTLDKIGWWKLVKK